jgi:serine/arginine repetitive matrix protein 2
MSEYEPVEDDEISSAITPLETSGDNNVTEDLDKTTRSTGNASRFASIDEAGICKNPQTSNSPPSSLKSVRKKDVTENSDQSNGQANDDSNSFGLSRQLSRICKEELSVFDFATPRPRGKTVGCTPQPLATADTRSPLARFPIAVQPTHRLTPGTLTKRVVGDSGGKLLFEDTQQVRLIPSPSDKHHPGLSADLWEADAESITSELRPSPLHINRRKHRANTDESDRRWPRLFDRGDADPPTTLEMLSISAPTMRDDFLDLEVVEDNYGTPTEGDRTPRGLGHQGQGLLQATPAPRGLQRSASTIITPTQSVKRLEHKASFNLEATGQSGFTPEHRRESIPRGTFPRSGMMLNLQSTQERLGCPLYESDGMQLSKSINDTTPKARRLPDLPDPGPHEPSFAPKEWMRFITATPRKSRTMKRNDGRTEDHREASSAVDWRKALFQPSATMDEGDVERSTSATTRDFSQSHKLQKQPSRARLTPSSTYRSSNQRLDHSTRALSPIPPRSEADVSDRRTPSPTASQTTVVPQTPSSSISGIFRKRIRSDYNPPATPRTPAEPTLAWSPFANCEPEPPCASPWVSGNGEGKREKEKRAAYFRTKVEREFQSRQSPKRFSRKNSLESASNGDSTVQNNVAADNRVSKESLIQWKQFLEDAPEPLFSSPLPPVPPLPSESQLNFALNRLPQTQTPSRATSRVEATPAATYREKKPQGLTVETRKLRKAMHEGAQTPSRNKSMTPASGSSFRSAFRLNGRRMSFGRPAADHESQGKGRETETFPRRK